MKIINIENDLKNNLQDFKFELDFKLANTKNVLNKYQILSQALDQLEDFTVTYFKAKEERDEGWPGTQYEVKATPDFEELSKNFEGNIIDNVTIKGRYNKTEIFLSLNHDSVIYGTAFDMNFDVYGFINNLQDIILLNNFKSNSSEKEIDILEKLKSKFQLNINRTIDSYEKLASYPDIFNEFSNFILLDQWEEETPITVEGYTAKMLNETTHLNPLGAYNYLIYLRTNPQEALIDLKNGLPRK